jgi:Cu/Ag efflux protein CusF
MKRFVLFVGLLALLLACMDSAHALDPYQEAYKALPADTVIKSESVSAGKVVASTSDLITLNYSNIDKSFTVTKNTIVYDEDQKAKISIGKIKAGDRVRVMTINKNDIALAIVRFK